MTNCANCGQQIPKEQTICPYCGAAQKQIINEMNVQQPDYGGQNMQQGYGQPQQGQGARKPVNGKKIGIIAGIIVALVLVIVFVIKFTGPGAPSQKAALKLYLEAIINRDADDFLDACFSKKLLKGLKTYVFSIDNFEEEIEFRLSRYVDNIEDVRNIKIIDRLKMPRSGIRHFEDELKDHYNVKIKISKMVRVECEYETKEDGKWKRVRDSAILYETGGKWFVWGDAFWDTLL